MSTLDAPDNRRKKGGRQVARPNRPWTQKELASRPAYNAAGVMLTRADMKELGSTDNNSDDGEYDAKRDAALSYDVAIAEMRRRKEWREKLTAAKRIEFIGNCMMIEGDCLEVMPQIGKVDAVVTDPPYGIGWKPRINHQDQKWVDEINFDIREFLVGQYHLIWGGQYFADKLPVAEGWLTWCKRPVDGFDFSNDKRSYSTTELAWRDFGKPSFFSQVWDGGMRAGSAENRTFCHPSQKPIELMEWCVKNVPTDAKTILDPFMGSGTTGVACVKTGRHFIGIELDPDYFEIACRRVREAYAQPDLLIDAPKAAPEVQEAFEL